MREIKVDTGTPFVAFLHQFHRQAVVGRIWIQNSVSPAKAQSQIVDDPLSWGGQEHGVSTLFALLNLWVARQQ